MHACYELLQVTEHVAALSKWIAADLYAKEIDLLQFELSMPKCSRELWQRCQSLIKAQADLDGALRPGMLHSLLVTPSAVL